MTLNRSRKSKLWREVRQTMNETPALYFSAVKDIVHLVRRLMVEQQLEHAEPVKHEATRKVGIASRRAKLMHRRSLKSLNSKKMRAEQEEQRLRA